MSITEQKYRDNVQASLPTSGSWYQNTTRAQWLALTAALLGWMFDGAEMGVFSLVGRQAVKTLLRTNDEGWIGLWFGVIMAGFLVGAASGGVLFGWLGDRIGRVRAMTLSVFTYAFFTGLCGLVTEVWQIAILRFIAALGMGGEWSLGVALVMEIWPNRSRAFMAGLIGAAANVGYLLVGFVGLGMNAVLADLERVLSATGLPQDWVQELVANRGWRVMMILGTLPALLTFFIRLFVPESERWQEEKASGSTSGWATRDLVGVGVGTLGPALIVYLLAGDTMVQRAYGWSLYQIFPEGWAIPVKVAGAVVGLLVATLGYLYPVKRYLERQAAVSPVARPSPIPRMLLGACLSGVALLGTWGSTQWAPSWADKLTSGAENSKEYTQIWLAVGAIVGTIAAALAGDWLGRRKTYFLLCILSLGSVYLLYLTNTVYGWTLLGSAFLAGVCTASFYGWLPLYLPELFHTNVRATGQGFGFNFGRILAAVGVLQTGSLMGLFQDGIQVAGVTLPGGYPSACSVMSLIYLVGMALIWIAPETRGQPLPE